MNVHHRALALETLIRAGVPEHPLSRPDRTRTDDARLIRIGALTSELQVMISRGVRDNAVTEAIEATAPIPVLS